jgi:hypothetical protein
MRSWRSPTLRILGSFRQVRESVGSAQMPGSVQRHERNRKASNWRTMAASADPRGAKIFVAAQGLQSHFCGQLSIQNREFRVPGKKGGGLEWQILDPMSAHNWTHDTRPYSRTAAGLSEKFMHEAPSESWTDQDLRCASPRNLWRNLVRILSKQSSSDGVNNMATKMIKV